MLNDGRYDPIQGQGQGQGHGDDGPKVAKMAEFKLSVAMPVIKPITVNYDASRQLSKFCPDRLLKFVLIRRHVTYKVCEELSGSPVPCGTYLFFSDVSCSLRSYAPRLPRTEHIKSVLTDVVNL